MATFYTILKKSFICLFRFILKVIPDLLIFYTVLRSCFANFTITFLLLISRNQVKRMFIIVVGLLWLFWVRVPSNRVGRLGANATCDLMPSRTSRSLPDLKLYRH